jgi:hypothetical protein
MPFGFKPLDQRQEKSEMADKQRLKCFGDANMSDACSQCPDNKECVEETVKRWRRRVKKKQEKSEFYCFWRERLTTLEKCRSCYDYLRGECDPNAEVLSLR